MKMQFNPKFNILIKLLNRMIRVIFILLLAASPTLLSAGEVESSQLLQSAHRIWPQFSNNDLSKHLNSGLWNDDKTALAVVISNSSYVFLAQAEGTFLAVNISRVEDANLGKLGIQNKSWYDRVETIPLKWEDRKDKLFQVTMQTSAWKNGKKYTVAELLLIKNNGTVLWR
ncbi:MAG: hypothetical protein H7A32_01065 [Deltaproteobacteria bacterium]|nr:hypothetical protein [Deltaproteobacteria bacterium]